MWGERGESLWDFSHETTKVILLIGVWGTDSSSFSQQHLIPLVQKIWIFFSILPCVFLRTSSCCAREIFPLPSMMVVLVSFDCRKKSRFFVIFLLKMWILCVCMFVSCNMNFKLDFSSCQWWWRWWWWWCWRSLIYIHFKAPTMLLLLRCCFYSS